jgi:hypothetical protein
MSAAGVAVVQERSVSSFARAHEIHALSAQAQHTIYSAVIEGDLRVLFRIDGSWVTTLDVGTHKLYRA